MPHSNASHDESSSSNEMDDVKAANKLINSHKEYVSEDDKSSISSDRVNVDDIDAKSTNDYVDEPIYVVPYVQSVPVTSIQRGCKYKPFEATAPTKIPARTSSLTSIDERGESDGILEEFCFHGYKHGCTAPAQRPEQVSEEIFKENWLRRLESLREREANLRDKEILLEERERLLFSKEKELRILERLVNDKLKQAELYLKRSKSSQSIDSVSQNSCASQRSSVCGTSRTNSSQSLESRGTSGESQKRTSNNVESTRISDSSRCGRDERAVSLARCNPQVKQSISSISSGNSCEEKTSRRSIVPPVDIAQSHAASSHVIGKSTVGGFSAYSSLRCKPRPKITYDDLDSTLSADIGDSSFVVTSRKFDPEVFKKPYAFTRSASERRSTPENERNFVCKTELRDKLIKRVSDNIFNCQDKSTTYQNYGLIDPGVNAIDTDEARDPRFSIERSKETVNMRASRVTKDRPVSWNEESNEWLRKKRQAYNMSTRRMPNDDFEDKENLDAAAKRERADKCTKKTSKVNKFAIFR